VLLLKLLVRLLTELLARLQEQLQKTRLGGWLQPAQVAEQQLQHFFELLVL
jgi:hypothetical protein